MAFVQSLVLGFALLPIIHAVPSSYSHARKSQYPFTNVVAFGDELTDNGDGSYAHEIAGNSGDVYRTGTSTNGPVAVSYLASMLDVPLIDHAVGGYGGEHYGATLNSSYTVSPTDSPSLIDQISHYSSSAAATSLGFIWAGQNDLSVHTDAVWLDDPRNTWFANNYTDLTVSAVKTLLETGLSHVLVANLYPKHIAPLTQTHVCGKTSSCSETWGHVIQRANSALHKGLAPLGDRVIYYDAFSFMTDLASNAASYGFTEPLTDSCDGDEASNGRDCVRETRYFWQNLAQPTTRVHKLIARDMKRVIDAHLR